MYEQVYACRAPPKKRKLTVQDMCTYGTKGGSNGAGRIIMSLNMYADAEVVLQSAPSKEKVQRFYRFHIKHGDMWILSQQVRQQLLCLLMVTYCIYLEFKYLSFLASMHFVGGVYFV